MSHGDQDDDQEEHEPRPRFEPGPTHDEEVARLADYFRPPPPERSLVTLPDGRTFIEGGVFGGDPPEGFEQKIVPLRREQREVQGFLLKLIGAAGQWLQMDRATRSRPFGRGLEVNLKLLACEIIGKGPAIDATSQELKTGAGLFASLGRMLDEAGARRWPIGLTDLLVDELRFYARSFENRLGPLKPEATPSRPTVPPDGASGETPDLQFGSVALWGVTKGPVVFGNQQSPLTTARYAAVEALIVGCIQVSHRGELGVSLDTLKLLYGKGGNPNKLLEKIRNINKFWRESIRMGKGKVGYWVEPDDGRHARG